MANALRRGEVDVIQPVNQEFIPLLKKRTKTSLLSHSHPMR